MFCIRHVSGFGIGFKNVLGNFQQIKPRGGKVARTKTATSSFRKSFQVILLCSGTVVLVRTALYSRVRLSRLIDGSDWTPGLWDHRGLQSTKLGKWAFLPFYSSWAPLISFCKFMRMSRAHMPRGRWKIQILEMDL